ncbi:MAG TPA: hypothetical protein VKZ18_26115 [Polyangia bacterium]|nr:hypothetical protein [Polyangia bacterium]
MLAAALAAAGCGGTPLMYLPGTTVASRRLAAFPSDGIYWTFYADGKMKVAREGSVTARANVDESIAYRVQQHGGQVFRAPALENLPYAPAFHEWAFDSLVEIMDERRGRAHRKHGSVGDWVFRTSLARWRTELNADYVLVSAFSDGHNTPQRQIGLVFGGGLRALRPAITCAVQLQTGRIVWCNFFQDFQGGDLLGRAGAQELADGLLEPMLRAGDGAPLEPPPPPAPR